MAQPSLRDGASLHRYPGTSCQATISLSLRDKSHSPIEVSQNFLSAYGLKPWAEFSPFGATGKASHRGHRGGIVVGSQEFDRCKTPTVCIVLTPNAKVFTHGTSSSIRIPLRGLCDLCAMLSSSGVLARHPKVFTTALSSLIFQLDPEKASLNEEREPRRRGL
jgi:hypothetical protein